MICVPCSPTGAFFLISWVLITQFRHAIYQIEAEYLLNDILYITVDKELKIINSKKYKNSHFLPSFFLICITQLFLYV